MDNHEGENLLEVTALATLPDLRGVFSPETPVGTHGQNLKQSPVTVAVEGKSLLHDEWLLSR